MYYIIHLFMQHTLFKNIIISINLIIITNYFNIFRFSYSIHHIFYILIPIHFTTYFVNLIIKYHNIVIIYFYKLQIKKNNQFIKVDKFLSQHICNHYKYFSKNSYLHKMDPTFIIHQVYDSNYVVLKIKLKLNKFTPIDIQKIKHFLDFTYKKNLYVSTQYLLHFRENYFN